MRHLLRTLLLTAAFAIGTVFLGWWIVPLLAVMWGAVASSEGKAGAMAAASAGLAWTTLLAITALQGPVGLLAAKVGGVMGLPAAVLVASTVAFAVILVGSGAHVGAAVKGIVQKRRDP